LFSTPLLILLVLTIHNMEEDKKTISGRFQVLKRIEKLDDLRVDALWRQDAPLYYSLCNELGVEPEDNFLYTLGEAGKINVISDDSQFRSNVKQYMMNYGLNGGAVEE